MNQLKYSTLVLLLALLLSLSSVGVEAKDLFLSGTINSNLPIHMKLTFTGADITGCYSYDRFKLDIALEGVIGKENVVFFKEFDINGKVTGIFRGTLSNSGITGTWSTPDGKKTYPLVLTLEKTSTVADDYFFGAGVDGIFVYDLTNRREPKPVKHWQPDGPLNNLHWHDGYLYAFGVDGWLEIYDVQNPLEPLVVSHSTNLLPPDFTIDQFFIEKMRLVLFDRKQGVVFIDLTNKAKPTLAATYAVDSETPNFSYQDNKGYFYDESKFYLVDFRNIKNPVTVYTTAHADWKEPDEDEEYDSYDSWDEEEEWDEQANLLVQGKLVYIFSENYQIVFDLTDLQDVKRLEFWSHPRYPTEIKFYKNQIYALASSEFSLWQYDPKKGFECVDVVSLYNHDCYWFGQIATDSFVIRDNYIYIARYSHGLAVVELNSNKFSAIPQSSGNTGYVYDLFVSDDQLILNTGGIEVRDLQTNNLLRTIQSSEYPFSRPFKKIFLDGTTLRYVGDSQIGCFNLQELQEISREELTVDFAESYLQANLLYSFDYKDLSNHEDAYVNICKVTPTNLELVTAINMRPFLDEETLKWLNSEEESYSYTLDNIFCKDNYLYVSYTLHYHIVHVGWLEDKFESAVVDLTNLQSPVKVTNFPYFQRLVGWIDRDIALTEGGGLLDLRHPESPRNLNFPDPDLYKLWDPINYTYRSSWPYAYDVQPIFFDIAIKDNIGFAACGALGLRVYDLSDPLHPILLQKLEDLGVANGLELYSKKLYVANGYGGYYIYDVQNPHELRLIADEVRTNLFFVTGK